MDIFAFPRCRELTAHRVNGLNEALRIFVLDGPGPGGASHKYVILRPLAVEDAEAAGPDSHPLVAVPPTGRYWISRQNQDFEAFAGVDLTLFAGGQEAAITEFETFEGVPWRRSSWFSYTALGFQNGAIKEAGVNGISQEALIAVMIDRLEGFQSGQFKCHDNQVALDHLQSSRLWLHKRTMERATRGVEGTLKA